MRIWNYTAGDIAGAVRRAGEAALRGELRTPDDFQAWLLWAAYTDAGLRGTLTVRQEEAGDVLVLAPNEAEGDHERIRAARTLNRTVEIVASLSGWRGETPTEDVLNTTVREAGFWPVVASVAVAVARVAAIAWCASKAIEVADKTLARNSAVQELARSDAQARALVESHIDREKEAGRVLPLDDATKAMLQGLQNRQRAMGEALATTPKESGFFGLFDSPWALAFVGLAVLWVVKH